MGSKSTTVQENKVPAYLEEAGQLAVEEAKKIKEMGYLPYFGPEVAAINPYEQAMAQNVGGMASAFGMAAPSALDMSGVDTMTSGGITGYTTAPAYFAALERLKEQRPDQYDFFSGLGRFDPITGAVNPNYNPNPATNMSNPLLSAAGLGGGGDDGPVFAGDVRASHRAFFESTGNQTALDRMDRAGQTSSGDFDPLGPTGNVSIDLSGSPLSKLF